MLCMQLKSNLVYPVDMGRAVRSTAGLRLPLEE
jgi:hypothetical protein